MKLVSDKAHIVPRERQLSVIFSITQDMLEKAKNNHWETVISLEAQRHGLIADYFAVPVADQEAPSVAHYINKVLEIDKQLIELGNSGCQHLREDLQKINHGKRAMKGYTAG